MKVLIGFSTSEWWVSKVIRFFTRAPEGSPSHAYIVFDEIPNIGHEVYQAMQFGFEISCREKLTRGTTRIVEEISVDLDPQAALSLCRQWLGTPYDYPGLLGEVPVMVGRLFGQRWRNVFAGAHTMFCSEAVTYLLQLCAGSQTLHDRAVQLDARTVDPYQLQTFLHALRTP